jgi:hypothetical protein
MGRLEQKGGRNLLKTFPFFMITEAAKSNFKGIMKGHVHAEINHLISFEIVPRFT